MPDSPNTPASDDELLQSLFDLLGMRVDEDPYADDGAFAAQIEQLPVGLRAMAATHWLDISLTLDDIGWHFLNFGEPNFVRLTGQGLRELGLEGLAEWFAEAHTIIRPFIDAFENGEFNGRLSSGDQPSAIYYDWLNHSGQSERIGQLSNLAWSLKSGTDNPNPALMSPIYQAWLRYARVYPNNVFD